MVRTLLLVVALAVAVALGAAHLLRAPAVKVKTEAARVDSVVDALDEDGLVRSDVEVTLAPKVQGRLLRLAVQSGQRVARGQLIAELERADLAAARDAALANEKTAEVALQEARTRLTLHREKAGADLRTATAAARAAEAVLRKAEGGARPQERRTAEAALQRAQARWDEANRDLERRRLLFSRGFIPRSELEAAQTNLRVAEAAVTEARQSLSMAREGPRLEDRQAARADLDRMLAQVDAARAQDHQLELSAREIEAAETRLEAARAQVRQAQAALDQGGLVSPAAGVVDLERRQPGDIVGPQAPVARLTDPARIWVEVLIDENDRGKVKLGQKVSLTSDAYPDQDFRGQLTRLDSVAFLKRELRNTPTQDEDRVFRARVELETGKGQLFPGMSVFAEIVLRRQENVLTIPREALVNREGRWLALVDRGGVAREVEIEVGQRDVNRVEVKQGLKEGDLVVLNPGALADGARLAR